MAGGYWHSNYWHANYWHANYWARIASTLGAAKKTFRAIYRYFTIDSHARDFEHRADTKTLELEATDREFTFKA